MITRHGDALVVSAEHLAVLARLIVSVERECRRDGSPTPSAVTELSAHVSEAADAHRTLNRHRVEYDRTTWVTARQYSELTGCTDRTARRHAQERGRKLKGRWFLEIQGGDDNGS